MVYADYLKSTHWKQHSAQCKDEANYECELCYSDYKIATHHKNYYNLGREIHGRDTIVLCEICHQETHFGIHIAEAQDKVLDFIDSKQS